MCLTACLSSRWIRSEDAGWAGTPVCPSLLYQGIKSMQAGCRVSFLVLAMSLGFAPLACRHNNELLENELRERDQQFREALAELNKAEHRSDAQQREIDALRKGAPVTPEQAAQTF